MKMQCADLASGIVPYRSERTRTVRGLDGIHPCTTIIVAPGPGLAVWLCSSILKSAAEEFSHYSSDLNPTRTKAGGL